MKIHVRKMIVALVIMMSCLMVYSTTQFIALSNLREDMTTMQENINNEFDQHSELIDQLENTDIATLEVILVNTQNLDGLLGKAYLSDYTEPELQGLVIRVLNDTLKDEEILADLITDVLEDQGFYEELDEDVYDYMEDFFLQMMLDIMAELEAEQAGGN